MSQKETLPCPDYTHQLPKKLADFLHQRQDVKYNKFEAFRYLLELQATASAEQDAAAPVPVTLPLTVLAEEWGWHRHTVGAFLEGLEKLGFVTLQRSRSSSTFTLTTLSFPAA